MAENDNTITLVGRIGQEPELRGTSKGEVCSFTLATSERRRAADGSWSDGPDRKSTRLNSSHSGESRMPSSA